MSDEVQEDEQLGQEVDLEYGAGEQCFIKCFVSEQEEMPQLDVGFGDLDSEETLDGLASIIAVISHETFIASLLRLIKSEFEERGKEDELDFFIDRLRYHNRDMGSDTDEDPVFIKPSVLGDKLF